MSNINIFELIPQLASHIEESIKNSAIEKSNISKEVLLVPGMSQRKNRHLLNNLANMPGGLKYLEVGLYKGATFISSLYGNKNIVEANGIDNWSEFQDMTHILEGNLNPSLSIKQQFEINFNNLIPPSDNIKFYDKDCWLFDKSLIKNRVNLFLYDGHHSYASQKRAYTYFNDVLDDVFVTVIDDWECNTGGPKYGTIDAFNELGYKVLRYYELPGGIPDAYHCGICIALISKK